MNELVTYDNYKKGVEEGKKKLVNNDFLQDLCKLMENEESSFNPETNNIEGEHTPQLFANDHEPHTEDNLDEFSHTQTEKLFDQDSSEEEDFEIPAFLRKQKF